MTKICYLCSGTTDLSYIIKRIPTAAQIFKDTAAAALEETLDFEVFECHSCGLTQFPGSLVPYFQEVIRSSNLSKPMMDFRQTQFQKFLVDIPNGAGQKNIFELGAGQGEYLDIFAKLGCATHGVEGSKNLSKLGKDSGHNIQNAFLDEQFASSLKGIAYDAAVSFNFIEHLPDPRSTLKIVLQILKEDSLALFEVPNFDMISNYHLFNEFIPDHRFYFTKKSFSLLLELSGFEVLEISTIWDNYIISAICRPRPKYQWLDFELRRIEMKKETNLFFSNTEKHKNAIWSAGHQSLATISNFGLQEFISYIIDSSPAKQGTFAPGSGLEIIAPNLINDSPIEKIMVAAAGFNDEIVKFIRTNCRPEIILSVLDKGTVRVL